ncbi:MAG: aminodeoxychorismate synthase component I [Anaerostipes sp.]|nr:aminodeoxychorismate synthase component I [Anaerostipes sp.]
MKTWVEKLDKYRPLSDVFDLCYEDPMAVFLDSSLKGKLGRWSIIGLSPFLTLEEVNGKCYQNGEKVTLSFEEILEIYLKENYEENKEELPMCAGGIGYFSYEYGRKFEQIKSRHGKKDSMPEACITFYNTLLIEDCKEKVLYVTARGITESQEESVKRAKALILSARTREKIPKNKKRASYTSDFTKEEYVKAIEKMIDYIVQGDMYIANMTQRMETVSTKHPYEVYRYLREHNPSPFGCYLNYGEFQIVSASPERFMQMKDGRIQTRPIKGTRKRGQTREKDDKLRQELEQSEKDRSELLMIVDLERNDLNRVCVPGSVKVTEHFAIEAYATVFHLVSTIVGKLQTKLTALDLIGAAFPGGSITGAPKIRAMEIIDELEHSQRGLYTGSMGYISFNGDCDFNIVIRTAVHRDGKYLIGVGGGITCESKPEDEYEETLQKAKAILEAIYENTER